MTASCAWRSQLPEPRVAGSATYRLSSVNRNSLGGDSHSRTLSSKVPQSSGRPLATRYSAFSSSGSGTPRCRSHAAISSSVAPVAPGNHSCMVRSTRPGSAVGAGRAPDTGSGSWRHGSGTAPLTRMTTRGKYS